MRVVVLNNKECKSKNLFSVYQITITLLNYKTLNPVKIAVAWKSFEKPFFLSIILPSGE